MRQRDEKVTMLQGYVSEAESHVEQQTKVVEQLRRDGNPTSDAELLLAAYQGSLAARRADLDIALEEARLARLKSSPPSPT